MTCVVGVPKEHRPFEYRVGLTPRRVSILTAQGCRCYVETGAGLGSGFTDTEYEKAGARISYDVEEVFRRADLILKVQRPTAEEVDWMRGHQVVMALMLLTSARESRIKALEDKKITAIAYELIEEGEDEFPVRYPLSQIGGRMTAQIAAQHLQNNKGSKGILLGGVAGVPPADVVIVGAGVVGLNAAQAFLDMGARVILMDNILEKLHEVQREFGGHVTTMVSHEVNLMRVCKFADVLVGALQIPRQRVTPVVTREMVQTMRPGSLIIDMSIDQGGCVETSRPTRHDDPTFVAEGVIHFCVPNIPGVVGRSATQAFLNAAWPYIKLVAVEGVGAAIEQNPALRRGLVMHEGQLAADVLKGMIRAE